MDTKYEKNVEIETIHSYHSVHKVVSAILANESAPALATGMVSLENHASLTLREFGLNDGLRLRACKQALPYALHFIRSKIVSTYGNINQQIQSARSGTGSALCSLNPFPNEEVVASLLETYLGQTGKVSLQPLEDGQRFRDLSLVRLWSKQYNMFHGTEIFLALMSHIVADILALSLLVPEELPIGESNILLLYVPNRKLSPLFSHGCEFKEYIARMLQTHELPSDDKKHLIGKTTESTKSTVGIDRAIEWALKLVGHDVGNSVANHEWVASSFRGQVLLPSILLASEIPSSGFACLSHFSGILMLETQKDRQFSRMLSKGPSGDPSKELEFPRRISAKLNAFPKEAIKWEMSSKAEHLQLSMGWTFDRSNQLPMNILEALMQTVMMPPCSHPVDAKLSVQARPIFLPPGRDREYGVDFINASQIVVFPLYGNEQLKLLALASIFWNLESERKPLVLVNRGACIDCVLSLCKHINCTDVIL